MFHQNRRTAVFTAALALLTACSETGGGTGAGEELAEAVAAQEQRIAQTEAGLSATQARVGVLETASAAQQAALSTLETSSTAQQAALATLLDASTAQQDAITTLEDSSTLQGGRLTALETAQAVQQTSVAALQTGSLQQALRLDVVEGQTSALNTELATARARVAALEAASGCAAPPYHCDELLKSFTFNALDEVTSAVNLFTGRAGLLEVPTSVGASAIVSHVSHLRLLTHTDPDQLQAGVQGGNVGAMVGLGTAEDVIGGVGQPAYGHIFGALRLNAAGTGFAYGPTYRAVEGGGTEVVDEVEIPAAASLYDGIAGDSLPVVLGHYYLARITDSSDPNFELLFKFRVTRAATDVEATIRYQVLLARCGAAPAELCTPVP